MAYAYPRDGALDYFPCRYGNSRLLFRGPRRDLSQAYVAVLGGTEVYGKFVPRPFCDLLEERTGRPVVNLGLPNTGLDAFLNDPDTLAVLAGAETVVVQAVGAHNLSNRFYTVHPRRNDRLVAVSSDLRALYRRVDFTEFSFTRHLLRSLQSQSPVHFAAVAAELSRVWLDRMKTLLGAIPGRRILLWMSDLPPPPAGSAHDLSREPVLVDQSMISAVQPLCRGCVQLQLRGSGPDLSELAFPAFDAHLAAQLPGAADHRAAAEALARMLMPGERPIRP